MPHAAQVAAAARQSAGDGGVRYDHPDDVVLPFRSQRKDHPDSPPKPLLDEKEQAESYDFDDDDEIFDDLTDSEADDAFTADSLGVANPRDLTKAYVRQKKLIDPSLPETEKPKINPQQHGQKPKLQTKAWLDDQIASLSKHAGKIKVDKFAEGMRGSKHNLKDKSDRATTDQVLDPRTRMLLLKMINRNLVSEINGCISTGKEANVYHAVTIADIDGDDAVPSHRAIKVYKTAILVFKDREKYISGDHRFQQGYQKGSSRAMVRIWAEKEMRNLKRIFAAGIPCPEPIYLRAHVLVMSFVGDKKGYAAPRLKEADLSELSDEEQQKKWHELYVQCLSYVRRMYQVCRLVHGDLSEYNILYHQEELWFIDVSQSVEHDHPRSLEFLRMDIKNVTDFFRRNGIDTLCERSVFGFVTAIDGSSEFDEMKETLRAMLQKRSKLTEDERRVEAADDEVFRQSFIPQSLQQIYNIETDAERYQQGQVDDLIHKALLAQATAVKGHLHDSDAKDSQSQSGSNDSDEVSDEGEDVERDKTRPRGKKHIDKDEKRSHKQAVKEEKREKRKSKMPKYVKNRMVNSTARKK